MVRMYAGTESDTSVSRIIHSSTAKATPYRKAETIPIMMEPVRREQHRHDLMNAILANLHSSAEDSLALVWFQDILKHKLFRCVTGNILEGLQIFLASGIYFVSHGVQINLWCSLLTVSHHFLSRTVEMLLCPACSQQPGQHYVNDKSI